jgi:hypothetical protein
MFGKSCNVNKTDGVFLEKVMRRAGSALIATGSVQISTGS